MGKNAEQSMTNADRIRSMPDKELAEFLSKVRADVLSPRKSANQPEVEINLIYLKDVK